ncbi:MAG: M16 family metallopeptidase [Propionibacteriaceae bacterium]
MTSTPRPRLGKQPAWSFPAAREHTLSNGLRVWVFDLPGQYVTSVAMALDLPLTAEPAGSDGIANIAAHALDEGTRALPGPSYSETLEGTGAVIGAGVSQLATHVSIDVPVTGLVEAFPLLADAIRTPALADEDVLRHIGLRRAEIQQVLANSAQLAAALVPAAVFDDRWRASRPTGGSTATLEAFGPEDVRAFHATHYSPTGSTLVVAGDFAGLDPLALAEAAFGDWLDAGPSGRHEAPSGAAPRRRLVSRPGAVQADVRIAAPAVDRTDPRWAAFHIACSVLGGTFQSRLNTELRERRGFTYGVSMSTTQLRHGGYAVVGSSFRTEVVPEAVTEALRLLDVAAKPFTAAEVRRAASYLTRVAPLRYATASGVSQQAVVLSSMGLDWRHVDESMALIRQVTPEQATAAFTEIWPEDPAVIVVGDPALADGLGVEAEAAPAL